jgi:tetratricopeptide (TPR) repeat protein
MAPEQAAALEAVRAGRPVPGAVDARSDVHALGLLLRETLWGSDPGEGTPGAGAGANGGVGRPGGRAPRRPPDVSLGLSDIIHKCLSPDPSGRYRDAAALGNDLRLHLNDLPLRGVANRSPLERFRKWRRRLGPPGRQAVRLSTPAAIAVAVALTVAVGSQRLHEIGTSLEDGRRLRLERNYPDAVRVLGRGLQHAALVPGVGHLRQTLAAELDLARRGREASDLHRLADLIRFRYGLEPPDPEEALMLARRCRALWDARQRLVAPVGQGGGGRLDEETERAIKTDLLELATVWAELDVRLAPGPAEAAARRAAREFLDRAEAELGPKSALDPPHRGEDRGRGPIPGAVATTPGEHFDLGRRYLRSGQIAPAAEEFRRTLDRRPQDFWPNFYQGLCAYWLGDYKDACAAFRTCIALQPEAAECYYNRALAQEALGRGDRALADYGRALELDPDLTAAALNRGLLSYKAGRHRDAITDFHRAIRAASAGGSSRGAVGQIHYNLALAYLAAGDPTSALASSEKALGLGCSAARPLCDRLRRGS